MIKVIDYIGREYVRGKADCWTLIQDIFKNEHGVELPSYPCSIDGNESAFKTYVMRNINLIEVTKADTGCIIYLGGVRNHAGYCLSKKQFIHHTYKGVKVEDIPKDAKFYKVV